MARFALVVILFAGLADAAPQTSLRNGARVPKPGGFAYGLSGSTPSPVEGVPEGSQQSVSSQPLKPSTFSVALSTRGPHNNGTSNANGLVGNDQQGVSLTRSSAQGVPGTDAEQQAETQTSSKQSPSTAVPTITDTKNSGGNGTESPTGQPQKPSMFSVALSTRGPNNVGNNGTSNAYGLLGNDQQGVSSTHSSTQSLPGTDAEQQAEKQTSSKQSPSTAVPTTKDTQNTGGNRTESPTVEMPRQAETTKTESNAATKQTARQATASPTVAPDVPTQMNEPQASAQQSPRLPAQASISSRQTTPGLQHTEEAPSKGPVLPLGYLEVLCIRGMTDKIERKECKDCMDALESTIATQPAASIASSRMMRLVALECLPDDETREAMEACVEGDPDRLHQCAEQEVTRPKKDAVNPENIPPENRQPNSGLPEQAMQQAARVAEAMFARRASEVADRIAVMSKALNLVKIPEHLRDPIPVPHPFGGAAGKIPNPSLSFGPDPSAAHAGGPISVDGKDLQFSPKIIRLERDPKLVIVPDDKDVVPKQF